MFLEQEPTIVDETSLLMVVNNDWTMIVDREQLWTMVVDNSCWQGAAQHRWQGAAQHCNKLLKLLTTLIKLLVFARVVTSNIVHTTGLEIIFSNLLVKMISTNEFVSVIEQKVLVILLRKQLEIS